MGTVAYKVHNGHVMILTIFWDIHRTSGDLLEHGKVLHVLLFVLVGIISTWFGIHNHAHLVFIVLQALPVALELFYITYLVSVRHLLHGVMSNWFCSIT